MSVYSIGSRRLPLSALVRPKQSAAAVSAVRRHRHLGRCPSSAPPTRNSLPTSRSGRRGKQRGTKAARIFLLPSHPPQDGRGRTCGCAPSLPFPSLSTVHVILRSSLPLRSYLVYSESHTRTHCSHTTSRKWDSSSSKQSPVSSCSLLGGDEIEKQRGEGREIMSTVCAVPCSGTCTAI